MNTALESHSPMMRQWFACKEQAKEAVLFFRLGDFYEAFYEDAHLLSKELDLTLTQRQGIPMSGIPFHTFDTYLERLVAKGYVVAVAEQMEDPKKTKGIVKREIVRMISPATILNAAYVEEKANNFFAAVHQAGPLFGLALLDFSTGELLVAEMEELKSLLDELYKRMPSEILISEKSFSSYRAEFEEIKHQFVHSRIVKESWLFDVKSSYLFLKEHFKVQSLDAFGLQGMAPAIGAVGVLLSYLQKDLGSEIGHIHTIAPMHLSSFTAIDRATQRHLELLAPLHSSDGPTLLSLLDQTQTPMGGRLLKTWVTHPLLKIAEIEKRQDAIEELYQNPEMILLLRKHLSCIRDIERLIMRIETGYASPRDLLGLRLSLEHVLPLKEALGCMQKTYFTQLREQLEDRDDLIELLKKALSDEPPLRLTDGNIFKKGYSNDLDELTQLRDNSQSYLLAYQNELRETLQVKNLRVSYNKAFGYYIEVSRGQADKVPPSFERRQTLVNAERFISPQLKEFEHKILFAEEKIKALEYQLFQELRKKISAQALSVKTISKAVAHLDVLVSLAAVSKQYRYIRPKVDEGDRIEIEEGRHPVIEKALGHQEFIPNTIALGGSERLMLITGPNMAGKSTFIRQNALLVIMAQIGCFIPALSARIGIVDKVFSRIGASDDLSRGQSTFMVEMIETANILNNATERSLVILDEIGRGTSTYDGISIAWAVAEYLLTTQGKRAKTLFATHYWELTEMEEKVPGAANYHVVVKESDQGILFMRKIAKGSTDKSYGIHVAKLAGIPLPVLRCALIKLQELEKAPAPQKNLKKIDEGQFFLFAQDGKGRYDALGKALKDLDINRLSPLEAMQTLFDWQKKYGV